jgi:predicted GNAT family acetyltransferase
VPSAIHYREPAAFLERAGPSLRGEEVRYALILGVSNRLMHDLHEYGVDDPWFLTLEEDGELSAAALRTPPFDVLVASFSEAALEIAERLAVEAEKAFDEIPGVVGEPAVADTFAAAWCKARGVRIGHTMRQRIYGLTEVNSIVPASGRMRQASMDDRELVERWLAGFYKDTFGHVEDERIAERGTKMLRRGDVYLWEDDLPVSMAARTRPTGEVVTIGMVYTPPEHRNRGYASSCVAALCAMQLESGYRYCTLYTDLSNPTSNKIYKRIGFKEVCDSVNHTFSK